MVFQRGRIAVLSEVRTVAETGSTNADMLELARAGAPDGLWLRAERQVAGRGRQGRGWESAAGNLYASTIVRLRSSDPPAATLALVAAVALHDAVSIGSLKWPNDLHVDGAKLSGILLERTGDAVVMGFGVNVTTAPDLPDRKTTTLVHHGIETTPAALLDRLAASLSVRLAQWRDAFPSIHAAWLDYAHPLGTPLSVNLPDGTQAEGFFDGLGMDGALALRLASGERRVIHAGDVFQL